MPSFSDILLHPLPLSLLLSLLPLLSRAAITIPMTESTSSSTPNSQPQNPNNSNDGGPQLNNFATASKAANGGGADAYVNLQDDKTTFTVEVGVGAASGGGTYTLAVDTGSPYLMMASSGCQTCGSAGWNGQQLYTLGQSSTYASVQAEGPSLDYAMGSVTGQVASDVLTFGGLSATVSFMAAQSGNPWPLPDTTGTSAVGIFPLAHQKQSADGQYPGPIQALFDAQQIDSTEVGLLLQNGNAQLTLGGADGAYTWNEAAKATVQADMTMPNYEVPIDGMVANGVYINLAGSVGIIDTGSTMFYGPNVSIEALYVQAGINATFFQDDEGHNVWAMRCTPAWSWGAGVKIGLGGKWFTFPYEQLVGGPVKSAQNTGDWCEGNLRHITELGGIRENPDSPEAQKWIIGLPFLRSVYSSFDVGTGAVNFWALNGQTLETNPGYVPPVTSVSYSTVQPEATSGAEAVQPSDMAATPTDAINGAAETSLDPPQGTAYQGNVVKPNGAGADPAASGNAIIGENLYASQGVDDGPAPVPTNPTDPASQVTAPVQGEGSQPEPTASGDWNDYFNQINAHKNGASLVVDGAGEATPTNFVDPSYGSAQVEYAQQGGSTVTTNVGITLPGSPTASATGQQGDSISDGAAPAGVTNAVESQQDGNVISPDNAETDASASQGSGGAGGDEAVPSSTSDDTAEPAASGGSSAEQETHTSGPDVANYNAVKPDPTENQAGGDIVQPSAGVATPSLDPFYTAPINTDAVGGEGGGNAEGNAVNPSEDESGDAASDADENVGDRIMDAFSAGASASPTASPSASDIPWPSASPIDWQPTTTYPIMKHSTALPEDSPENPASGGSGSGSGSEEGTEQSDESDVGGDGNSEAGNDSGSSESNDQGNVGTDEAGVEQSEDQSEEGEADPALDAYEEFPMPSEEQQRRRRLRRTWGSRI